MQQITNADKQTELQKRNGIRGIMAVPSSMKTWYSYPGGKLFPIMNLYSGVSSDEELMADSSGGNLPLAPTSLGPKIFVTRGDYFNKVMGEVSRELVWLRWFEIGQRSLPSWLSLKKLRVLELYEGYICRLEELWEADSDAPVQLRELVISGCLNFQRFPNSIGRLNVLKKIVITSGFNLTSLPEEFCCLQSLEHLRLLDCQKLSSLPNSFGDLRNLQFLDLTRCENLRTLPVSFKNLRLLQYLCLSFCAQLTLRSDDFQNITKLEYLNLSWCSQQEELPHHVINQTSLRELNLEWTRRLRELPINIGQLNILQKMIIGTDMLTSLPASLGELSSLTNLSISDCPKLESLPTSLGDLSSLTNLSMFSCPSLICLPHSVERLNLLEHLTIGMCPIKVDFEAASFPFGLRNLKHIFLYDTEVCRISISEDRYPRLESLYLSSNDHLTEIEALPTTVKLIDLRWCKMLKNIRVTCDLVNLERLKIVSCPLLDELPSFARSTSLRIFELVHRCYRIEKIDGLEYCTRLESLSVETCWEVPGIQSLEHVEKLKTVKLRANKASAIERCIQTIQKWPGEMKIFMRAVPDASSLLDSLLSPNLVVLDSFAHRDIQPGPKLVQMHSSNGNAIMLCFVINSVSSEMRLKINISHSSGKAFLASLGNREKGRWLCVGIFTLQGRQTAEELEIEMSLFPMTTSVKEEEDGVEKGLVVRGEEQTVVEAFRRLLPLLQSP